MFEPLPIQRPGLTRRLTDPAEDPAKIVSQPIATSAAPPTRGPTAPRPQINRTLFPMGAPGTAPAADSARVAPRPQVSRTLAAAGAPAIVRPDTWTPTLNSGSDKATGAPVYDNASIDRLVARRPIPQPASQPAAAGGVQRRLIPRPAPNGASTFGQSVRTMPDDNQPLLRRPQVAVRGVGEMAEYYNASEDRAARQKLASDLGSQRFRLEMIAGNPGRRGRAALDALGQNAQQQAALAAGGERLSAEAIQNRAQRGNVLANTGMEQAGQDRRTQFDADNRLGIAGMNDATNRAQIAAGQDKGETITSADGRVFRLNGNSATLVTDADGKPITQAAPRDPSAITPGQVLDSLGTELKAATDQLTAMQGINGTATPEQTQVQQAYVQNLQQQINGVRGGRQGGGNGAAAGAGADQQQRARPGWEQFQARAKAQGSRMTPEQLRAYYDQMQ